MMTAFAPSTSASASSATADGPAPFMLEAIDAERLTKGTWIGGRRAVIRGATVDSRQVTPGCLFACLPGVNVDGHDFAASAVGSGAALVLATRKVDVPVPVLVVNDVTVALARLATEFRRRFAPDCVWIGVAGANGKTTTKELVAAACAAAAPGRVHATRRNLNNQLGVPLTVLATPAGSRFAVIEIGANHPGEVSALAAIARPQVGLVTSIGPEHLEGFGDLLGVARAECELLAALPAEAPALIGLDGAAAHARAVHLDPRVIADTARAAAKGRRLTIIGGDEPDAVAVGGSADPEGSTLTTPAGEVRLRLLGRHNLANACIAFHAAVAAGVPAELALAGLAAVAPVPGRLTPRTCGPHLILDDSYNANPASMTAGLAVLAAAPGRRLAVLGYMGELGEGEIDAHRRVGAETARLGLPLIAVGAGAFALGAGYRAANGTWLREAADATAAAALAAAWLAEGPTTVLVKASRSARLEIVVQILLSQHGAASPASSH